MAIQETIRDEIIDELLGAAKTSEDLFGADGLLKMLSKQLMERLLEAEMTNHLGYIKNAGEGKNSGNSRNGKTKKTVKTGNGDIEITVPRDRESEFTPVLIGKFCQNPLKSWIGVKTVSRFINYEGTRIPNPKWRPFVATLSKAEISQGKKPNPEHYSLSQKSLQDIFTVNSSFFNFLLQEDYAQINPVQQIRQKSKYFTKQQTKKVIRKLSELQWGYVIETAYLMAELDKHHERTLHYEYSVQFIFTNF